MSREWVADATNNVNSLLKEGNIGFEAYSSNLKR